MGEYADMYDEYALNGELGAMQNPEDIFDEWGIPTINISKKSLPIEKNYDYNQINDSLLKMNDDWLLRKDTKVESKIINEVVIIKQITEKAVLFEFANEWKNKYHWQMKGKQFWLPKSILYKHKKHIKVIYIPKWAVVKIINLSKDETR